MTTRVLVPGLAADHRMWLAQQRDLGARWPTAVASAHQACDSISAMAQAVLNEFDGDLLLCGASMGGMVALEAVRLAPSRICGLALLGTLAHPESPEMYQLRSDAIALFGADRLPGAGAVWRCRSVDTARALARNRRPDHRSEAGIDSAQRTHADNGTTGRGQSPAAGLDRGRWTIVVCRNTHGAY
jgi:pimeloyl-ACP methyl ester carboxylesterase